MYTYMYIYIYTHVYIYIYIRRPPCGAPGCEAELCYPVICCSFVILLSCDLLFLQPDIMISDVLTVLSAYLFSANRAQDHQLPSPDLILSLWGGAGVTLT